QKIKSVLENLDEKTACGELAIYTMVLDNGLKIECIITKERGIPQSLEEIAEKSEYIDIIKGPVKAMPALSLVDKIKINTIRGLQSLITMIDNIFNSFSGSSKKTNVIKSIYKNISEKMKGQDINIMANKIKSLSYAV
ncbi:hypothetical protein ACFL4O_03850, partial [bacterium]